jgi:hypothetical protein
MNARRIVLAVLLFLGLGATGAMAQGVLVPVTGYDTNTSYYAAPAYPAANYAPAYAAPTYAAPGYSTPRYAAPAYPAPAYAAPVVAYRPAAPQYVQPVVAYRPAAVRYVQPAVAYRPVVPYERPYAAYRPVIAASYDAPVYTAYSAPAAVPAGPKVWVHPKVYVQGQPIRNFLTAITP